MEKRQTRTRVQLLLQCDIASTSTSHVDSWKPPLTSTPLHSNNYPARKESCSFLKFNQMQTMRTASQINPLPTPINFHNFRNNDSYKNNQLVKSRNRSTRLVGFDSSDTSSDEDDCRAVVNKKLVIKLNANKSNKIVENEKQTVKNVAVSNDKNMLSRKRGLKVNNANNSKLKISPSKQVEVKKRTSVRKQSNVKDLSILDKENLIKDVKPVKSRLPIRKKSLKISTASSTESDKPQKRKRDRSELIKNEKKLKVTENELEELPPAIAEEQNVSHLGNEMEITEGPLPKSPEILRTEEKVEILEKSRNSSQHQLFSETKEQEFMESLDLTAVEMEEPITMENKSPKKKTVKKIMKATKKEKNNCSVLSDRPVRSRKPPKEYWLPPSDGEKPNNHMVGTSSDESEKNQVPTSTTSVGDDCDKQKKIKTDSNNVKKNPSEEYEQGYFTSFEDLDFKKNSAGYESAECCLLPKFKSGVLKIKSGAKAASKTKRKNNAFGGVLMKGCAKMKIGDIEKDIKMGEVIFVPPLTEWVLCNDSQEETVMYYWCGQF